MKKRRIIQFIFLALLFIIPILNMCDIYVIKGTYISLDVGGLAVSDPVSQLQAFFISHTFTSIMIISVMIPVIIVLLFGRIWCSWACPYYLLVEFIDKIRHKLKLRPLKPAYSPEIHRKSNMIRFLVFIGMLTVVGVIGLPLMYLFSPPSVMSSQMLIIIKYFYVTLEFAMLILMIITEFFLGYRFWCRYICPTGTCLSFFQTSKSMHVSYSGECSLCQRCVKVCPMILDPKVDNLSSACNNCGECINICPDNNEKATLYFKTK